MDGIAGVYGIKDTELVNKAFLATGCLQYQSKGSTGPSHRNPEGY